MGFQKKAAMRGMPTGIKKGPSMAAAKPRFGARMTRVATPGLDNAAPEMAMPAPGPAMKKGGKVC
jgi:hypothetical protein